MSGPLGRLQAYPRAPLAHAPTPLEPLPRLGAELGLELLVKRDDQTGLALGGNKARQLEFYFGAAREQGADTVLITGAVQSNYMRMAAAAAARLGMAAHVQLEARVPGKGPEYAATGNAFLMDLLGAVRHDYPEGEDEAGADARLRALAEDLQRAGRRPYVIPLGPDNPPLGALGYVAAARELAAQVDAARLDLDAVVVASGSGMTHAGLLVGLRALGLAVPVIGVCVRRPAEAQAARVRTACAEVATLLGIAPAVAEDDIHVHDRALAPGYGRMSGAVTDAVRLAARREGLLLDPVYTGKVMAELIALARGGAWRPGARVLFVHTGGTPALFAYAGELG